MNKINLSTKISTVTIMDTIEKLYAFSAKLLRSNKESRTGILPGYKNRVTARVQCRLSLELACCSDSVSHSNTLYLPLIVSHVWKFFSNPRTDHDRGPLGILWLSDTWPRDPNEWGGKLCSFLWEEEEKKWWGQGTVLAKTLQLGMEQAISLITEFLVYHWCNKVPQIS